MLISDFGMVFRISKRGWRAFCKAKAERNDEASLRQFGGKVVGVIDFNITDMTREEFAEEIGMEIEED